MTDQQSKKCTQCNTIQPMCEFKAVRGSRYLKTCQPCRIRVKIYRSTDAMRDKKRAQNRAYYEIKVQPNLKDHYAKYEGSYKLYKERIRSGRDSNVVEHINTM